MYQLQLTIALPDLRQDLLRYRTHAVLCRHDQAINKDGIEFGYGNTADKATRGSAL